MAPNITNPALLHPSALPEAPPRLNIHSNALSALQRLMPEMPIQPAARRRRFPDFDSIRATCTPCARSSTFLCNPQCIGGFSAKLDGRRSVWRQVCQTCAQSGPSTAFHTSGIRARPGPGCRSLPMEESAGSPRQLRRRRLPARPRGRCGGTWRVGRLQALGSPDGTPRRWRRGLRCPFRERDRRARSGAYTRSVASGRRVRYRRRGDARGPRSNR